MSFCFYIKELKGCQEKNKWECGRCKIVKQQKRHYFFMLKEVGKWALKSAYFLTGLIIDPKDIYVPMHLLILTRISPRISKHLNDTRDLKAFYCVKYIDPSTGHSCRSLVFHFSLSSGLYRGCQVKCHQKDNSLCRDIICISSKKLPLYLCPSELS